MLNVFNVFQQFHLDRKHLFDLGRLRLDSYRNSASEFYKLLPLFRQLHLDKKSWFLFELLAAGVMLKFQKERL